MAGTASAATATPAPSAPAGMQVAPEGWSIFNFTSSDGSCQIWGQALEEAGYARAYFCDGTNPPPNSWALWVLR